ncbi:putative TBPIP domain-containing protein [Neospora caninum Liverpool]|uniref:Putative TBPIP domain-containing protein n=1 Tax=Neospora caninum (strain Liverpool) TaxID=572307 RepID=F0VGG0_NEOCL|nr:putative TBPIP domain-containing protein [Neospora caninum Liverpool]CBZ52804.1 putative TBPIP domain-containing protein [Neospora caninum Liverpool]CEL66786.1 TPA: TBPIP domain-containing protein, putative [Neospora caninum Liverpool]|eukprot:XP_003882836.1 putative TBPIP domain-containing protein [Neospora caninum Liverpool]
MGTQKATKAPPPDSNVPVGAELNNNSRKRTYTKSGDKQEKVKKPRHSNESRKNMSPREANPTTPLEPGKVMSDEQVAKNPRKGKNPVVPREKTRMTEDSSKGTCSNDNQMNPHLLSSPQEQNPTEKASADHVQEHGTSDHILEQLPTSINLQRAGAEAKDSALKIGNGCSSKDKPVTKNRHDTVGVAGDKPPQSTKTRGRTKGSTKKQEPPNVETSDTRSEKHNCSRGSTPASNNIHEPPQGDDYPTKIDHHEQENVRDEDMPIICTLSSQNEACTNAGPSSCVAAPLSVSTADSHRLAVSGPSDEGTTISSTRKMSADESRETDEEAACGIDATKQKQLSVERRPEPEKAAGEGDRVITTTAKKTQKGNRGAAVKGQKTDKNENMNHVVPPSDRILCYMKEQNRPYNAQIIFDNLQKSIKKADVERILDELTTQGSLIVKDIGKMKVYMYEQSQFGDKMTPEEMSTADGQISALREEIQQLEAEMKVLKATLSRREAETAAVALSDSVQNEIDELKLLLKSAATGDRSTLLLTADEINKTKVSHHVMHAEWARRKKICMELLGQISEATGHTVDELVERLGVEIDEDYIPDEAYKCYS